MNKQPLQVITIPSNNQHYNILQSKTRKPSHGITNKSKSSLWQKNTTHKSTQKIKQNTKSQNNTYVELTGAFVEYSSTFNQLNITYERLNITCDKQNGAYSAWSNAYTTHNSA